MLLIFIYSRNVPIPITLRILTDTERAQVAENAIYGIIDGHHRFNIALELGQGKILAVINESDSDDDSDYRDIVLAYRLNESTIKMSSLEKGKRLCSEMTDEE